MNRIKQAWNWKPDPATMKSLKIRSMQGLVGFLVVMICCTLVSRAADTVTVPVVKAEKARQGNLVHRYTVSGTLEASGGVAVMVPASLPVTDVHVKEGDTVQAGDLLFECDTAETMREIAAKRLSIESVQMEITIQDEQWDRSQNADVTALDRADEDYQTVADQYDLSLREAGERLRLARLNLMKYDGRNRGDYDDETYSEAEYESFRSEFRSATIAYDRVLAERDSALREKERVIEDLAALSSDSTRELKLLDLRRAELELSTLQQSVADGGRIYAPADGILTRMDVDVGRRTTGEAAAIITNPQNLLFAAEITKEQREYVQPGDYVELTLSGERYKAGDMPVLAVLPLEENPDFFRMTVEVPGDLAVPGRSANVEITQHSIQYSACIPLSALYSERENQYYVLSVREVETVLGPEYQAERLNVTVLEKNDATAAVSGPLSPDTLIITESGRTLRDGDRIRLQGSL